MELKQLAHRWPEELTRANSGLDHETRRGIFVFLLQQDSSYSFRELGETLGIKPDLLSYHLSQLLAAGLIENTLERREDSRDRSFYFVSEFGQRYADKQLEIAEELWSTVRRASSRRLPNLYLLWKSTDVAAQTRVEPTLSLINHYLSHHKVPALASTDSPEVVDAEAIVGREVDEELHMRMADLFDWPAEHRKRRLVTAE